MFLCVVVRKESRKIFLDISSSREVGSEIREGQYVCHREVRSGNSIVCAIRITERDCDDGVLRYTDRRRDSRL